MQTYREWLLNQLNNGGIDLYRITELRRFKHEVIDNSNFETARHLLGFADRVLHESKYDIFCVLITQSALNYIDYLHYSK